MAQTGNVTSTLALSGSATTWYGGASASLFFSSSLNGVAGISGVVNASLNFSPGVSTGSYDKAIAALSMNGVAVGVIGISGKVAASFYLDAIAKGYFTLSGSISASLQLSAVPVAFFVISGTASAAISLNAQIIAALSETFQAFVMNTKTLGATSYTNYGFNSLFKGPDGFYYGCNTAGIFRLTGKNDNGAQINAVIVSGVSDFNERKQKYFPDAYLALRCEGEMEFSLKVDENKRRPYPVDARAGIQGIHTKRRKLAQGVKGRYAQIEIRNVAGSDFDLQGGDLIIEPTRRT